MSTGGAVIPPSVNAFAVFDDHLGGGPALYAAGYFIYAGNSSVFNIAKWNGASWSGLNVGNLTQDFYCLTVFDDGLGSGSALYAGGNFTSLGGVTVNRIAKWNGATWTPLGPALSGPVTSFAFFDDHSGGGEALFVGGSFTTIGSVNANHIAKWNGTNWVALGNGLNSDVYCLAVFNDGQGASLYAGGRFTNASGIAANSIAKWNGTNWSAVGSGIRGVPSFTMVNALAVYDDGGGSALYAGGSFTNAGGVAAASLAKWRGQQWTSVGGGVNGRVNAITIVNSPSLGGQALYAAGYFTAAGGVPAKNIARWGSGSWSALGDGANEEMFALAAFDDGSGSGEALYAGGLFSFAYTNQVGNQIAKWNGTQWVSLSSGLGVPTQRVRALAVHKDASGHHVALYVGGNFWTADEIWVRGIAKWNGQNWEPLGLGFVGGSGVSASVDALAIDNKQSSNEISLFAGGDFGTAGGRSSPYFARWICPGTESNRWSAVGAGLNNIITALAAFDDGSGKGSAVFAAGYFTNFPQVNARGVAKWDGNSWSSPGRGIVGGAYIINTLAAWSNAQGRALYAGGSFTNIDGVTASNLAKWDGINWSSVGSGANNTVNAIQTFDDGGGAALYVGGRFTAVGGQSANRIAKWNGTGFSPLGSGLNNTVYALVVFDDNTGSGPALYAGGSFSGGVAKWDGHAWSLLGAGINNENSTARSESLAVFDDNSGSGPALFVGGYFTSAGGKKALNIAKWDGHSWSALPELTTSGITRVMAAFDDGSGRALFVGQDTSGVGHALNKWNGHSWSTPGSGMSGAQQTAIYALLQVDEGTGLSPTLYAGGAFLFAGGARANYIATWPHHGRPRLGAAHAANRVSLSWPSSAQGYLLQQSPTVSSNWVDLSVVPAVVGGQNIVTVTNLNAQGFFRLRLN